MSGFFSQQRQARRKTWLLLVLFVLAVGALIALAHWPFLWLMSIFSTDPYTLFNYGIAHGTDASIHLGLTLSITAIISTAILYKYWQLRRGGSVIAEQLGGQLVQTNTYHEQQRVLLNVVEEVAIAARMPVPSTYLLANQPSINAFAAGYHRRDSVIAITQGALDQLSRAQLQAVVAHEFSHIVNGDVRLNVRMSALLYGITFIGQAGENLIYSAMNASRRHNAQRTDGAGFTTVIGVILTLFGWLGTQLGDIIKALVCRQREYLADAGAAQFTRNPQALAGALLAIAENPRKNTLRQNNAHLFSHYFFSDALSPWLTWLSTHPPLRKRIRRLDPHWHGQLKERPRTAPSQANTMAFSASQGRNPQPQVVYGDFREKLTGIEDSLSYLAHEPSDARWLVMLLCLHQHWPNRQAQLTFIAALPYVDMYKLDRAELALTKLSTEPQFRLLEVAIGAIRCLPKAQRSQFLAQLKQLAALCEDWELVPWSFQQLSAHALADKTVGALPVMNKTVIVAACEQLLGALASYGHANPEQQRLALAAAAQHLQIPLSLEHEARCQLTRLQRALRVIKGLPVVKRQQLLEACRVCVEHDAHINEAEQTLLYTLAACLEIDSIDC